MHTKFTLTLNEVMPPLERSDVMAELSAFHEKYGFSIREDVLEPKLTVRIETDRSPGDPRNDDNVGVMFCQHRRDNYGDKYAEDPRQMPAEELALCLPIYMYEHGGVTVSHSAFSCPWDSGQLGAHYVTKAKADAEWGAGKWTVEQMTKVLEGELWVYDQFLKGNVWGYIVEDEEGNETDACWGFYGDTLEETGILDYLDKSLHEQAHKAWEDRFDG